MCELSVFSIFVENDLSKVDKILGLMFFKARKDFQGFKTATQIADSQTEQSSSLQRSDFAAWTNPFTFNFKTSRVYKTVLLRRTYFLSVSFNKKIKNSAFRRSNLIVVFLKFMQTVFFSELNFTVSAVDR